MLLQCCMIKKGRGKNFLFPAPFRTKLQGFHRLGDGVQKRVAVQARGLALVKGHQVLGQTSTLVIMARLPKAVAIMSLITSPS